MTGYGRELFAILMGLTALVSIIFALVNRRDEDQELFRMGAGFAVFCGVLAVALVNLPA